MLGIVLLSGMLLLGIPQPTLAAVPVEAPTIRNPHQDEPTTQAHKALLVAARATQRMGAALAAVAGAAGADNPDAGHQGNAAMGQSPPLRDQHELARLHAARHATCWPVRAAGRSESCTGCHVDQALSTSFNHPDQLITRLHAAKVEHSSPIYCVK